VGKETLMVKYVAVLHHFWMESKRWEKVELKATTAEGARQEAALLVVQKQSLFNHVSATVVRFPCLVVQHLHVGVAKKLTWRQRLTGKL
jgi:hypothetical protein